MKCFLYVVTGVAVVAAAAGASSFPLSQDEERTALARAVVAAYTANTRAFPYYTCRFRFTKAQSRSIADAIAGNFVNATFYDSRLIVDSEKVLYEGLAPPEMPDAKLARPIAGKPGLKMVEVFAVSDRYLTDGKLEMNYTPQMRVMGLWDNNKGKHGVAHAPLHRLRGLEVHSAQPERYDLATVELEELEKRPVVSIRFNDRELVQFAEPVRLARSFSLDASRGHLPIRVTTYWNDKPQSHLYVTHIRECSNQRWFPERIIDVDAPGKDREPFSVVEILVLDLDADRKPAASEFSFKIPAGTVVNESTSDDATRYFVLKQEEKVDLKDLRILFSMLDTAQANRLMDTAIEVHRPSSWVRWLGLAVGLVLALGGAAYLMRRRKHAA